MSGRVTSFVGRRFVVPAALAIAVPLTLVATGGTAYAAGKVAPNPAVFTVNESATQDVVFQLDEPIIAITPNPTVNLTFTVDDPTRISVSPSTLEWDATEWFQTRTLTVTAIHDGIHDVSDSVVVHVTTASASEYYDGYTTSFTATIIDADPPPATTTTTTTTVATVPPTTAAPATARAPLPSVAPATDGAPQLAMTGTDDRGPLAAGFLSVVLGAILLAAVRTRGPRARRGRDSP